MRRKFLYVCILMCVATVILCGCQNKSENIEVEKSLSEVSFIENQTITIFNKFLNDEYLLEDGNFSWDLLNADYDILRRSVDVILIDFAGIQVPSKNIVDFEADFNELENYIYSRDVNRFMRKICDVYNLVSYSILDNISENEETKLEKKSKSDLLYCGYYIKTLNKEFALSNLEVFQENFNILSLNKDYIENNSYKINKVAINIKALKDEITAENYQLSLTSLLKILEMV